jgi:hypothetical protein
MKKLSYKEFARKIKLIKKPKEDRQDRFQWKADQVEFHPKKIDEKTFEAPIKEPHWADEHHSSSSAPSIPARKQFDAHAKAIEDEHKKHDHSKSISRLTSISMYKGAGHHEINDHLRDITSSPWAKPNEKTPHHIKNMEHVTSHPMTHEMHVYRGIHPEASGFHKLKPGDEFTDHGFTSTSMDHHVAHAFGADDGDDASGKPTHHVMKIHLPKGTLAHHLDAHKGDHAKEQEVVLHHGTRFKVSHHSYDKDTQTHYLHASVVGQK